MTNKPTILYYDDPRNLAHLPLVRLGDLLDRRPQRIELDDDQQYMRVTVKRRGQGAELRDCKAGRQIRTDRMQRISAGQLIVSKIDANQGAVAIVPPSLHGAVVTRDFPTYYIDQRRVHADFLLWVLTRDRALAILDQISSGTGKRKRITLDKLAELRIPLPPTRQQAGAMKHPIQ